ncbi:hypothetical protein Tco_1018615 [Tanacetum coccineum]|uniref:Uncharacterized protein n=1 Tax=Tanacetum coccineum TaxID=301880 RepID=A0ABQ5FV10_9ASTR
MDSKFVISTQTCTLLKEQLVQFLHDYDIPRDTRVILPKKSETIYDSLLGFVGLYTHYFSLSNLILPIPSFICDVLNYFKAYGGESSVDLLPSFLNLGRAGDWLTLSNRGGVDMPKALIKPITHLENWKGLKTSWKYSPKRHEWTVSLLLLRKVLMSIRKILILRSGYFYCFPPLILSLRLSRKLNVAGKRKFTADGLGEGSHHGARKVPVQASKVAGDASTPLDVDKFPSSRELKDATDCHWVVAHELISALRKAKESCDAIREREIKRDKAYAELEKKCNKGLQDLDKNPLVSDKRSEIEQTLSLLHAKIDGLESKKERLKASGIQLLQEIDSLRQDRAAIVTNVVLNAAMKLVHSDEMGVLIAKLVRASIIYSRCATFEEVAKLNEPFILEKMPEYHTSSKEEYDQARDDLANASYSFLFDFTSNPYAYVEQLLSKKPISLRSSKAP